VGFDLPLVYVTGDKLNQPVFGCNNLSGRVWQAAEGGGPAGTLPPHDFKARRCGGRALADVGATLCALLAPGLNVHQHRQPGRPPALHNALPQPSQTPSQTPTHDPTPRLGQVLFKSGGIGTLYPLYYALTQRAKRADAASKVAGKAEVAEEMSKMAHTAFVGAPRAAARLCRARLARAAAAGQPRPPPPASGGRAAPAS
jgi:hypothetical protein